MGWLNNLIKKRKRKVEPKRKKTSSRNSLLIPGGRQKQLAPVVPATKLKGDTLQRLDLIAAMITAHDFRVVNLLNKVLPTKTIAKVNLAAEIETDLNSGLCKKDIVQKYETQKSPSTIYRLISQILTQVRNEKKEIPISYANAKMRK
ncbi:hypothetical protein ES703_23796 [subsurface metagenome]